MPLIQLSYAWLAYNGKSADSDSNVHKSIAKISNVICNNLSLIFC